MDFRILDKQYDEVIRSFFVVVKVDYDYALRNLVPLVSKLDYQRNILRAGFYARLEQDLEIGCVMPPLTIAYNDSVCSMQELTVDYFTDNLAKAFVLDGIQRLSTLKRAYDAYPNIDLKRPIYLNVLICDSMNRLLYRMITLNNGQRPMSPRHQIEILASSLLDFESLPIITVSEKNRKQNRQSSETMSKDVIIKGYLAYVSQSYNIDNEKIIQSRMDELIADKIINSKLITQEIEFEQILAFISGLLVNPTLCEWFLTPNNFIGFCSSMGSAFKQVSLLSAEEFEEKIAVFEAAFSSINVSKIKLGLARRKVVSKYFGNFIVLSALNENELLDYISQEV